MTDKEYEELLDRIIKGAEYLANPLIKYHDYCYGLELYDELCAQARKHRWGSATDGQAQTKKGDEWNEFSKRDGKRNDTIGEIGYV